MTPAERVEKARASYIRALEFVAEAAADLAANSFGAVANMVEEAIVDAEEKREAMEQAERAASTPGGES